jgi:tetratricopeptide (TPR) repeat protein
MPRAAYLCKHFSRFGGCIISISMTRNLYRRGALLLILILTFSVNAQDPEKDSLESLLKTKKMHDTTRLEVINNILATARVGDPVSVHYNNLVKQIIDRNLAKKNLKPQERKAFWYYLAYWYGDMAYMSFLPDPEKAVEYNDQAIALFRLAGREEEVPTIISNKGNAFRRMGAFEKAVKCYFEALKLQEASGDKYGAAGTYAGISKVYEEQKNFAMAIRYNKKALENYESFTEPDVQILFEKGVTLHNLAFNYAESGQKDLAKSYFGKSMELDLENGFSDQASLNASKIGNILLDEKDLNGAEQYFRKGLALSQKDRSRAELLHGMGEVCMLKKDYGKSLQYLNEANELAAKLKDRDLQELVYFGLYQTYKYKNEPAKALGFYQKYIETRDLVDVEAARDALERQQLKYDYEKRGILAKAAADKKLAATRLEGQKAASRRNLFIYILLFVAVVLGGTVAFLVYLSRQKAIRNERRANDLKQKLLLSQMNPHFIFNSVDNIQGLIVNGQDREAVSYLTKFSKLTRQILEHSRENYILLSEEIEMLSNYLSIQRLLYNSSFEFTIRTDGDIDPDALLVPPMLTQPFVENAVKHGIRNKKEGGVIEVRYFNGENGLLFEVKDNGAGLAESSADHKSLSTQITRERLAVIAPERNLIIETGNITEENAVKGAVTRFALPYIHNN